jgi:hypothetical protein
VETVAKIWLLIIGVATLVLMLFALYYSPWQLNLLIALITFTLYCTMYLLEKGRI